MSHWWEDEFYLETTQDIVLDSSGNIFITGVQEDSYIGDDNIFLVKFNSSGHYQWHRIFDGGKDEHANCIALDSNNNIYIGGSRIDPRAPESEMLLIKYDSFGNYKWNLSLEMANLNVSLAMSLLVSSIEILS